MNEEQVKVNLYYNYLDDENSRRKLVLIVGELAIYGLTYGRISVSYDADKNILEAKGSLPIKRAKALHNILTNKNFACELIYTSEEFILTSKSF